MATVWTFETLDAARIESLLAEEETRERGERRLLCAACGHPITRAESRIELHGGHRHTCTNPHGLVFTIGCFREAPGCTEQGEAIAEWSWFPPYRWRVALCGGCGVHNGWGYHAAGEGGGFFGLILERLIPPS